MKKYLLIFLCTVLLSACSDTSSEDAVEDNEMTTTTVTTALVIVPPKYTISIPSVGEEPENVSTSDNSDIQYQKYKRYLYDGVVFFDLYEGPHDWEGASIKFSVSKGLYLTINNSLPVLYTGDIKTVDLEKDIPEAEYVFKPYFLAQREIDINTVHQKDLDALIKLHSDGITKIQNVSFDDYDQYKLYSFETEDSFTSVKMKMIWCLMDNGSAFEVRIKQGSEYEARYKDDIDNIASSFGYSEIDYIP